MKAPTVEELNQAVEDGWVRSSRHPTLPLTIFTYSHTTQHENHWNDVTEQARGIVYDDYGVLVQRPIKKVFNITDPRAPDLGNRYFTAYDKVDGSLILVSNYMGTPVVSTKGSFTSPQALAVIESDWLAGWAPPAGHTVLFEYIAPVNRIVVDYGDFTGLILLGAVRIEDGYDAFHPEIVADDTGWAGETVTPRKLQMAGLIDMITNPENGDNREGFMLLQEVPGEPSRRVKAKFAQYVTLHALMTGLTDKKVWECWDDGTLKEYMSTFPDEMYDVIDEFVRTLTKASGDILQYGYDLADRAKQYSDDDRAKQASIVTTSGRGPVVKSIAFAYLDNKPEKAQKIARKAVQPAVSTPMASGGAY